MERYIKLLFVALFATMSFALTSCGDDNDEPYGLSFGKININGKDYACYGYGTPITYCSTWENVRQTLKKYENNEKIKIVYRSIEP